MAFLRAPLAELIKGIHIMALPLVKVAIAISGSTIGVISAEGRAATLEQQRIVLAVSGANFVGCLHVPIQLVERVLAHQAVQIIAAGRGTAQQCLGHQRGEERCACDISR
jgi:hypothetical protein